MTPMHAAVQDVWGNAGDAEGSASRALYLIKCGDIEDATQALKLCIEQAKVDAVHTAITMHSVQLRKISASELYRVVDKLIRSAKAQGSDVLRIKEEELFMDAPLLTSYHNSNAQKGLTS